MKTIIAIPAYNCAPQLPRVLAALDAGRAASVQEVWVVDNGSADGTAEVAVEHAANWSNLRIFRNRRNVNLGGTHKTVFLKAREAGATHVVILHGDDQARAEEAYDLIAHAAAGGPQTVLGSRFGRGSRLQAVRPQTHRRQSRPQRDLLGGNLPGADRSRLGAQPLRARRPRPAQLPPLRRPAQLQLRTHPRPDPPARRLPLRTDHLARRRPSLQCRNVRVFSEGLGILARWRFRRDPWGPAAPASDYEWDRLA
ncbi:glycosyltransferase family 2 protein [Leifsonia xyli]|uniref:glycosyltransferase family 2 protein n=1 Tax=Leifsonia xyli TaxID=1575 RepID=UPI00040F0FC7|nr:glycosyltransferase family 2 protein [Leifsonia xyli]